MAKKLNPDARNFFANMGGMGGFGVDAEGNKFMSMMGKTFYLNGSGSSGSGSSGSGSSGSGSSGSGSNTSSNTSSNTTSNTSSSATVPTTTTPPVVPWHSVVSKYFGVPNEQPSKGYKSGGLVRGCGAAERGKTKGKMR